MYYVTNTMYIACMYLYSTAKNICGIPTCDSIFTTAEIQSPLVVCSNSLYVGMVWIYRIKQLCGLIGRGWGPNV